MQEKDNGSLSKYIEEISRQQVLTADEERELSERIKNGDSKAVDKLATANLRFVVSIANKYKGLGLAVEDLVSEGNIGLMKAAGKFDASRSRFVSYAVPVIRKYMEQAIDRQSGIYRVPRNEKSAEENRRSHPLSVDAPLGGRENVNLLGMLVNPDAPDADLLFSNKAQGELVRKALDVLDGREREVVACFYGIGRDRQTFAGIAAAMGLKRERVRQIRDKAVRKISKQLRAADEN